MLKNKDYKNGEKKGKQLGEKNKQIEIAKKLLARKMPVEDIQEITLLTKEEIEKLIINDK